MSYSFFVLGNTDFQALREKIFERMQEENLLWACMHHYAKPCKQDWLNITDPNKGWLLCCVHDSARETKIENLCGVAWLEPWKGQVWTFEFTAFRAHFAKATVMSKAALNWMFENAPCQSIIGLCANSNAHAWRLAKRAGFQVLGNVPGACFQARRNAYEDAVLVLATKEV